jgi:hypothetical protein
VQGGEQVGDWLASGTEAELNPGRQLAAHGSVLRELHAILKDKDPSSRFGGLVRVQNKRREFLWVHEQFAGNY